MTYSEQLKDIRWQKKRLEILNRDDWTCQECKSETETLHVHHKIYFKGLPPWEYDNNLLISLCKNCHLQAEEDKELYNKLVSILLDDGFTYYNLIEILFPYSKIDITPYLKPF